MWLEILKPFPLVFHSIKSDGFISLLIARQDKRILLKVFDVQNFIKEHQFIYFFKIIGMHTKISVKRHKPRVCVKTL